MKYLIRSVKYFFYFAALTAIIIFVLVFIGAVEGDINDILKDGVNSIWKMIAFFVLVAAIYPKFGFVTRKLNTTADWDTVKATAEAYFQEKPFKLESKTEDCMTFRRRDIISRLTKMGEDRISICRTDDGFILEGLRKEIFLYATGLEYSLPKEEEE